jgi:hypothetical protein
MENYKTFKSSNEESKVEAFKNNRNNITVLVVVNSKEYSLEYFDDETVEERTADFLSEYGSNENTQKAIELINIFISNL